MLVTSKFIRLASALTLLAWLTLSQSTVASDLPASQPCCQQSANAALALIELPQEAIQKLKIDAGFGWGIFSGTIYNGNDHYHITQLVVSMTPVHDHHHMHMHANMSHDPKVHNINLDLPPLSKGALSMALPDDVVGAHDFKWEILKVTGYPVNK